MDRLEENIRQLVREALNDLNLKNEIALQSEKTGLFTTIDQAVKAAEAAFHQLEKLTLETRKDIIANIRKVSKDHVVLISKMVSE